jgi:hypothetical protein
VSDEVVLHGGLTNAGRVTRVGDTVRRPQSGAATWALLEHLERAGFDGAPRFLGLDDRGREMLTYLPGEAAIEPLQDWVWSDDALVSVAELLRRYHDAAATFDVAAHAWPDFAPPPFRGGLVCHNDPNLDNVIFADGVAVGLIDFDLAAPGSAAWDVACAARLWAPLRDERDLPEELRGRTLERLRLFADAYGLIPRDRHRLVRTIRKRIVDHIEGIRRMAAVGDPAFVRIVHKGHLRRPVRDLRLIDYERHILEYALR